MVYSNLSPNWIDFYFFTNVCMFFVCLWFFSGILLKIKQCAQPSKCSQIIKGSVDVKEGKSKQISIVSQMLVQQQLHFT